MMTLSLALCSTSIAFIIVINSYQKRLKEIYELKSQIRSLKEVVYKQRKFGCEPEPWRTL